MTRTLRRALTFLALCISTASLLSAQKPDDQDDKDIKAYILNEDKFKQITASYADVAACRKQNRDPWAKLTSDPSYADATLTEKARMLDAKVPQCMALLKKHGTDTHEYLVAIESLTQATTVMMMRKRNMTVPAAKAAESVSAATMSFVESHYEAIEKWRQSIQAQAQQPNGN
jgi:hypothetical protein